jgi:virginiamycin B lyase
MNRLSRFFCLLALASAIGCGAAAQMSPAVPRTESAAPSGTPHIVEFPIPHKSSEPYAIVSGPDNALWFTESKGNRIGRVTTQGVFEEFVIPTRASRPGGIAEGSDHALWFTELHGNKIGRLTTNGTFKEYPLPKPNSAPFGITLGPDGALWFTEYGGGIAQITTDGAITEFPAAAGFGITSGGDGALWYVSEKFDVVRVTTDGTVTNTYPAAAEPEWITRGSGNALWYTSDDLYHDGGIYRMSPTGQVSKRAGYFSFRTAGIAVDPAGIVWSANDGGGSYSPTIGRLAPNGAYKEYSIPSKAAPEGLTIGPDGNVWFVGTVGAYRGYVGTLR